MLKRVLQASSSPLSPYLRSSGGLSSKQASASLPDGLTDGGMSRAVSAKPFSVQHSTDVTRAAHAQDCALPWMHVRAPTAAPLPADAHGAVSPELQDNIADRTEAGQLNADNSQAAERFLDYGGEPSPSPDWTFQLCEKQSPFLLDM